MKSKKNGSGLKKVKFVLVLVPILIVVFVVAFFAVLTVREYRPKDTENLSVSAGATRILKMGQAIEILTWNIGYGALGSDADFFMDGGKSVMASPAFRVNKNLLDMQDFVSMFAPDVLFLQEVDIKSKRSYKINEFSFMTKNLLDYDHVFSTNFKVDFIPYPIPPIGKVYAGIMTSSTFPIRSATRVQLPCPFMWPLSTCNLKRCLLVSRIPILCYSRWGF